MLDAVKKRKLIMKDVRIFVLDEADEMMKTEGGYQLGQQTAQLRNLCPKSVQIVCFSATFPDNVKQFTRNLVPAPLNMLLLKPEETTVVQIKQLYIHCGSEKEKFNVLSEIYGYMSIGQSMIFVRTRKTAISLAEQMTKAGYTVSVITGGKMPAEERKRIWDDFIEGRARVLISTNVMARGIDVSAVSLIINYDLPVDKDGKPSFANYLHRVGRTGRFGREGI